MWLQSPYIVSGLVPTGFLNLSIPFDLPLELNKTLKMVSTSFSTKFRKTLFFKVTL